MKRHLNSMCSNSDRTAYWDEFYKNSDSSCPLYPSQFAAFVLGEQPDATRIIEFGCGNGRDSEFFASYGLEVIAVDASRSAINSCRTRQRHENLRFAMFSLTDNNISEFTAVDADAGKTVLYARFFLHAINRQEEANFLSIANRLLKAGDILALEYRCAGDKLTEKAFGEHYRRYVQHGDLCQTVSESGFDICYQIEGRGFAKYKSEDAHVGRCIAIRK